MIMKYSRIMRQVSYYLTGCLLLSSCANYPTLIEVARESQAGKQSKTDLAVPYHITDRVVLNYTDRVKVRLSGKFSLASGMRYGSSTTELTLATLAASAETFGWSVSTASGLGMGAAYVLGLGKLIDAKSHAQAYEQAFSAIQSAEAYYYSQVTGMTFGTDANGNRIVILPEVLPKSAGGIPDDVELTPYGETLYYQVSKTLKVLNDVLANKIPELQDLKDATGTVTSTEAPKKTIRYTKVSQTVVSSHHSTTTLAAGPTPAPAPSSPGPGTTGAPGDIIALPSPRHAQPVPSPKVGQ